LRNKIALVTGAYSASKAALVSLIQTIALENKDLAITADAGKDVNGAAIPVYGSSL
jgi:hypothetical protein